MGKKVKKERVKRPRRIKDKKLTAFELYRQTLTESEAGMVSSFFSDLAKQTTLIFSEKLKLRTDFENALLYYNSIGVPLETALERLDLKNLGGFYSRPPILWYALDNAAKIYPLSIKHGKMPVFRESVYLKQPVVPPILQMALTFTIKRFPGFATTVKKGVFWHYLDTTKRRFCVEQESDVPCRPLIISQSGSQSFRVLYFNNRISVEFFHILTDGSGGLVFLKTLTAEYLRLLGARACVGEGVLDINGIPSVKETVNEFSRARKAQKTSGFMDKPAVQMSGKLSRLRPCRVLHFKMSATQLKELTRRKNTTVTAYILALMFVAGKYATDDPAGTINIQVPVNMRKYYPSETLQNFAMYCGIKQPLQNIVDVDSLLSDVSNQLKTKASKEHMTDMMNSTERMVSMLRYIPLFIKAPVARVVYGFLGETIFSNTLSNVGLVKLPPELEDYVDSMDLVLGTTITNRASCALITYKDISTLSVSKMTADPSFEEKLYELLVADGIDVCVEGSELYEG